MKLRYFLTISTVWLFHFSANSQTNVNGTLTQNTHWTLSGSPYTLTGTVGVINGITLTIDAGVQISGNNDLLIKGTLTINSSTSSHVSVQATRVIFKNTDLSLSTINFVDFNQGGVQLADESEGHEDSPKNSSTLTINNCSFTNGAYARTKGYETTAKLVLNNCTVTNSTIYGYYPLTEVIEINNSTLSNSTITSDSYNYGIKISGSTISGSNLYMGCCSANFNISGSQINNCSISEGSGEPVDGSLSLDNSTIINTPINLPSAKFSITNCNVSSNQNISYLMQLGNGIVKNSTVTGTNTETLFKITGYNGYNIGGVVDFENVTLNQFNVGIEIDNFSTITLTFCNFINANQYTVKNLSSKNINAQQNYWGTTDISTIQNQIFDLYDNANYGIVDYSNYLQSEVATDPVVPPNLLTPSICEVTVDNATSKNQIIWNYPKTNVLKFGVYRETEIPNKFILIGTTPNDQSSYIDSSSTPAQQAYKYSLSAFNSIGVETGLSSPHKTVHLQISQGGVNQWNLYWSSYEGFSVDSYKIYRGTNTDNLTLVATVPNDVNSFADLNPLPGNAYYQVRIAGPTCGVGIESNAAFNQVTGLESSFLSSINLYPNPVKNLLVIQSAGDNDEKSFSITDILGQQVQAGTLYSENSIPMDNLRSGVYFVKVQLRSQAVVKKIIKE